MTPPPPQLGSNSSAPHGGQDFIFYQLESFALLVKTYGDDSPQVTNIPQLMTPLTLV